MQIPLSLRRIVVLDVLSVALLAGAVVVFRDTRSARTVPSAPPSPFSSVRPGDGVQPLPVTDTAGQRLTLLDEAGSAGGSVLLAFRSDCPACAAQKAEWMALAREAEGTGWRVAAVTPEPLEGGVRRYFGDAPVRLTRIERGSPAGRALDVRVVPSTILVGPDGRVLFFGNGRLSAAALDSVRALLAAGGRPARNTP